MIASPEQAVVFLTQVKSLLLLAILGTIILVILAFLLYSLSRALIWNKLHHQKLTKKNYWKWNTLNLALIIPLLVIGLGFLIIRILFTLFLDFILKLNLRFYAAHTNVFDVITTLLEGTLSFFLVLLILIFIFLTYHLFIQKYKVWASIGKAFQLLKKKQRKIWRVVLFTLLTGLILTLITYPLKQYFLYNPVPTMLIQFGLSLLFVNWLRLYLFKTISLRH